MNPLKTVTGTIVSGFILAIIISVFFAYPSETALNWWGIIVWLHVFAGVIWIGLLYYFNFVQVSALAEAGQDSGGPGGGGITKYVAPRALAWFRWGAVATWLTGVAAVEVIGAGNSVGFMSVFFRFDPIELAIGGWLGTIMLFNVWVLIWPNQKKVLGLVEATDEQKASAKKVAFTASRINTLLSIPMLLSMVAFGHGGFPIALL